MVLIIILYIGGGSLQLLPFSDLSTPNLHLSILVDYIIHNKVKINNKIKKKKFRKIN